MPAPDADRDRKTIEPEMPDRDAVAGPVRQRKIIHIDTDALTLVILERLADKLGDDMNAMASLIALIQKAFTCARVTIRGEIGADDKPDFDLVVETGLGAGPQTFRSFLMHTFPASRRAEHRWSRQIGQPDDSFEAMPAYRALQREGMDRCGLAQLASCTVGVR
jgi:hypothetical protein